MFHGKTLKKSLSLILAVVLLASMCAVCFGTFASAYTEKTTLKYDFDEGTGISGYTTGLGNGYVDVDGGKAFNVKSTASNGNSIEIGRPDTVTRTDGGYNADALSFLPGKTYTVSFKFRLNAGTKLLRSNESQLAIERYHSAQAAYVDGAKYGYGNIFTKKLIEYNTDYVGSQKYTFAGNVEKTVYTVKQNTEWMTATLNFKTPTDFGTFDVDGNSVLTDRLCLVFGAADKNYLKDVNDENIDYKLDMLIDDMEITGIFDMSAKGARAYTFNWRNSEGTQAYTNSHDKISLTSHKDGNKGIADVMQESSGLTEDGMIIGGLTDIGLKAPGEEVPAWWYHKATVYGATSLGGATDGRVKLEANTAYTVSVKYIPLSINPDVSGVFAIGRVNSSGHAAYFGDGARTDYAPETAAYTQTAGTNTEVAHKKTYASTKFGNEQKTYKEYADAYIAKNGRQTLTYSFKLGADYNQNEYLAIFASASKNTLSNDTGYLTQFLVDSVTVVVSNPTDTVVTFVDGSDIVSAASANANNAVVAPAAPANTDKNFLYWKTKDNKMYQPGETITGVTSDMTVTAVYKEVFDFVDSKTGTSALSTAGHPIFSNSNNNGSYMLTDGVGNLTGGLRLKGTESYPHEVGKCDFKHHVYLYDPDSSFVTTAGYLQIQENMLYSITVNYKARANNSKIGISVSQADAVSNQRMTPLAISEVSSVGVEKKLSCVIDGDASITVLCGASTPDTAENKTLALAGKYVTITAGTNGTEVDIISVEVSAYVKPANETFVTAYTDNNKTIYSAKPGTLLLPAANNEKGEASLGWFDATTNEAVTTVVGTAPVTVYAKYPTVTFDFEDDAAYEFNPNNKEIVAHSVVASPNGSGKALKLTATKKEGGFTGVIGISALRGCTDAGYNFVAGQTYTVSYKAYMNSNDSNVGDGNKNNRPAVYRAGVNGIGKDGNKTQLWTKQGYKDSNFSDNEDAKLKYGQWIDMTYDVTFTEEQHPEHNYLIIGVHAPNPANTSKPNAVLYIDDLTITQNGTDLYKTTVVDTKSSLRKETEDKSAGLRFRGQLDETDVNTEGVSEIGFISIPKLALDRGLVGNDWYKLDSVNMTADKGKVGTYAAYVKINDFNTDAGYYARAKNGDYQYQLCITGLETDAKKAADFATVMFVKNSDGFRYYYVNTISYNAVKQAYEANGIQGY